MREQGREDHKSCSFCDKRFEVAGSEFLHVQREHEPVQHLHCPGCKRGPFDRVGALVGHIERGQCTRITSEDLVQLRETKLDFHRELEERSDEPIKGSYASYMSEMRVPRWADVVEAPSDKTPGDVTEADFPALPMTKLQEQKQAAELLQQPEGYPNTQQAGEPVNSLAKKWHTAIIDDRKEEDSPSSSLIDLSADEHPAAERQNAAQGRGRWPNKSPAESSSVPLASKWQGAWGTKDIQTALAKDREKRRVTPTAEQLAAATQPAPKSLVETMDIDDPDHPFFNASDYFSTVINKYICPKLGCGKYYNDKGAIVRHLQSPAHGDKSYQCPKCSRIFKSAEAITSHAESPGYCRIRETGHYGAFMDQITGGIVEVDQNSSHDTIMYKVGKEVATKTFW
ncbi:hypothetical protein V2A60_008369 [Cordyceps javanica]